MNGNSNGIVPTIDLATNNGGYGNGLFGGDGLWIIVILALLFNNGWGGFGGGFGGFGGFNMGMDFMYPWLANGQKEIMTNTNNGFDTLHLSNQIEGVRDGVYGLSNQMCNCCADINSNIANGFANAEVADNARQIANMQQAFSSQISTLNGFNNLNTSLLNASADNRLGIAGIGSDIAREACATRTTDTQNTQTLLTAITGGIQSIKDEIYKDRIDEKDDKIADLNRQLQMADLRASQTAQNAFIAQGLNNEVDALYNRLATCPINTIPVYGNQRIFTCPGNNGCGCGYNTTSQFI